MDALTKKSSRVIQFKMFAQSSSPAYNINFAVIMSHLTLLLLSFTQATSAVSNCRSEFDDVATKTVQSSIVFDGRADRIENWSSGVDSFQNVTFKVKSVFKGELPKKDDGQYQPVVVGVFGQVGDVVKCVAASPTIGTQYLVFLETVSQAASGAAATTSNKTTTKPKTSKTGIFYRISSFPEISSKSVIKDVQKHNSSKYKGKAATVKLTPTDSVSFKVGKKIELKCQSRGEPAPIVSWWKNGSPLLANKQIQIKVSKKGSSLRISKASENDKGIYQCRAGNMFGTAESASVNITIQLATTTPNHSKLCDVELQSYCLNGGTCYHIPALGRKYCRCIDGFGGERCLVREVPLVRKVSNENVAVQRVEVGTVLIILLVTAAVLLLIVVFTVVVCTSRRKDRGFSSGTVADKRNYHQIPVPDTQTPAATATAAVR